MGRGVLLITLLFAACATSQSTAAPQGEERVTQPSQAFLELASGKVVAVAPQGLHVRGAMEGGVFVPEGDVLGEGPLGEAGQPGWLELASGQFLPDFTARPPFPPYLKGYRTPQGEFRPSSRTVIYQ